MTWEPSNLTRWAVLGLADPHPDGRFPARGNIDNREPTSAEEEVEDELEKQRPEPSP